MNVYISVLSEKFFLTVKIGRWFQLHYLRAPHWVKIKNPNAPAVKREAEEDWGR
jgi:hypothetical protein